MSDYRTAMHMQTTQKNPYLEQKVMSASPEQLVGYIYDVVLAACDREDKEKTLTGLAMLVGALNFDYQELAAPLYRLYQYCQEQARQDQYEEIKDLIGGLKGAWAEAMKVK